MKKENLRTFPTLISEPNLTYVPPTYISLKDHPQFNEKWLQDRIEETPSILQISDELIVMQKERIQPKAGRLDLLLKDQTTGRRYTFELQLGVVDESHIIRAIEYWDNERKRYPEIEHCAIICAETINTRFLNVISLFNRQIPLIALQVKAVQIGDNLTLTFTKVLDEVARPTATDEDEVPKTDRKSYEERFSPANISAIDQISLKIQKHINKEFKLSYTKPYIGCVVDGRAANFITFKPHRSGSLRIDIKLRLTSEQIKKLEDSNVEVLDYAPYWKLHPINLSKDLVQNPPVEFLKIIEDSYKNYFEIS